MEDWRRREEEGRGRLEEGGRWVKTVGRLDQDRGGRGRKGGGWVKQGARGWRRVKEDRGECKRVQERGAV